MKREGTHIGAETTAARYDGDDVLRVSGRLKLVYDAAARGHDIPNHCAYRDRDGGHEGCFCAWAGA